MTVFSFDDYKIFLKQVIESQDLSWGSITRLSEAAGCQRSYLSRVLNSEVHLTPDHIYGLADYLKMSESETQFFLTLLEKERASSARYRNYILKSLKKMKTEHEDLQRVVQRPSMKLDESAMVYYSAWYYSAIHILVSIPGYQTKQAISKKLHLPEKIVEMTLGHLKDFGFVENIKGQWQYRSSERHISRDSPLSSLHHSNWRQRAIIDSHSQNKESIHFTVVQSMDDKAQMQIKALMLDFIDQASRIAGPSKEQKLMGICCDFWEEG